MLTLVSTPIGNLEDLSLRAIRTFKQADLILCEDTRRTKILLSHIEATQVPCKSYHTWNESQQIKEIITLLQAGQNIVLVSDAGTPLISDPGYELVRAVIKENIPLDTIPGPCAPIAALLLSGLPCSRFQFIGFLPKAKNDRKTLLDECCHYPGTSIAFESPHRIADTLTELEALSSHHEIAVARELTKLHQEVIRGTVFEVLQKIIATPPRGEIVLLIGPGSEATLSLVDAVKQVQALYQNGSSLSDAASEIAKCTGLRKKELYSEVLKILADEREKC